MYDFPEISRCMGVENCLAHIDCIFFKFFSFVTMVRMIDGLEPYILLLCRIQVLCYCSVCMRVAYLQASV